MDGSVVVPVQLSDEGGGAVPAYATAGSAGVDLVASHDFVIEANRRLLVSTGLKVAIPPSFYAQIQGRSGLATKYVDAHPGVIDSDYRGEVKVLLMNRSNDIFIGSKGDRIAQLLILPVARAVFEPVDAAQFESGFATDRGAGGFGSTGIASDPKVSKR